MHFQDVCIRSTVGTFQWRKERRGEKARAVPGRDTLGGFAASFVIGSGARRKGLAPGRNPFLFVAMASGSSLSSVDNQRVFSGDDEDSREYKRWKVWITNKLLTLSDKVPKQSKRSLCEYDVGWEST